MGSGGLGIGWRFRVQGVAAVPKRSAPCARPTVFWFALQGKGHAAATHVSMRGLAVCEPHAHPPGHPTGAARLAASCPVLPPQQQQQHSISNNATMRACTFPSLLLHHDHHHERQGMRDVEQLGHIFGVLGSPSEANWPGVTALPDYVPWKRLEPQVGPPSFGWARWVGWVVGWLGERASRRTLSPERVRGRRKDGG